jgi:hypothetical protein
MVMLDVNSGRRIMVVLHRLLRESGEMVKVAGEQKLMGMECCRLTGRRWPEFAKWRGDEGGDRCWKEDGSGVLWWPPA